MFVLDGVVPIGRPILLVLDGDGDIGGGSTGGPTGSVFEGVRVRLDTFGDPGLDGSVTSSSSPASTLR